MSKIFDFFKYLVRDIFSQLYQDLKEVFIVITRKKTWVFGCFLFLIVSAFIIKKPYVTLMSAILFLLFFIAFQWQVFSDEYTHQQRERYWKKPKK